MFTKMDLDKVRFVCKFLLYGNIVLKEWFLQKTSFVKLFLEKLKELLKSDFWDKFWKV